MVDLCYGPEGEEEFGGDAANRIELMLAARFKRADTPDNTRDSYSDPGADLGHEIFVVPGVPLRGDRRRAARNF